MPPPRRRGRCQAPQARHGAVQFLVPAGGARIRQDAREGIHLPDHRALVRARLVAMERSATDEDSGTGGLARSARRCADCCAQRAMRSGSSTGRIITASAAATTSAATSASTVRWSAVRRTQVRFRLPRRRRVRTHQRRGLLRNPLAHQRRRHQEHDPAAGDATGSGWWSSPARRSTATGRA